MKEKPHTIGSDELVVGDTTLDIVTGSEPFCRHPKAGSNKDNGRKFPKRRLLLIMFKSLLKSPGSPSTPVPPEVARRPG